MADRLQTIAAIIILLAAIMGLSKEILSWAKEANPTPPSTERQHCELNIYGDAIIIQDLRNRNSGQGEQDAGHELGH